MASLTLTRAQRDALRMLVLDGLTGIGDICTALMRGEIDDARILRHRHEGFLRLLDDLGWGTDDPGETFAITLDAARLTTVLLHLNTIAADATRAHMDTASDERDFAHEAVAGSEAVGSLLAQLAAQARHGC